jgi:hypothetical protein
VSRATADLNEEELKRYRAVQRLRHGITITVYDRGGVNLFGPRHLPADVVSVDMSARSQEVRVFYDIAGHSWVEIIKAPDDTLYQVRARGQRGGWQKAWRLTIPLP